MRRQFAALCFSLVLMALFSTGCGNAPSKWVGIRVESTPPGAQVMTSLNQGLGTTPTDTKLLFRTMRGSLPGLRDIKEELTISKDGYEPAKVSLGFEEYKWSTREDAARNPKVIQVTLKPITTGK